MTISVEAISTVRRLTLILLDKHSQARILAELGEIRRTLLPVAAAARPDLALETARAVGVRVAVGQRPARLALGRAEALAVHAQRADAELVVTEARAGTRVVPGDDAAADVRVHAPVRCRRGGHRHRGGGEGRGRRGHAGEAAAGRGVLGRVAAGRGVGRDCGGGDGGGGWWRSAAFGPLCAV